MRRPASAAIVVALLVPGMLPAQQPRLDSVLDAATAGAVTAWIDSARAARLPVDGLVGVALEGARRHAPDARIVSAVGSYYQALTGAASGLGRDATPAELAAGAAAILSGVSRANLAALRQARPGAVLTIPLVVLADLAARGVPVDTATRLIYVGVARGIPDDRLSDLRRQIEGDIRSGAPPGAAAVLRLENLPGLSAADVRRLWSMTLVPGH